MLNDDLSKRLADALDKQVMDPLNKGRSPRVGQTFHGIVVGTERERHLYALIMSLMTNDRTWHPLIEATEAVQTRGHLFGLVSDNYTMPRMPSSPPNTDLSRKRAEQIERLDSSAADAYTNIARIQSKTDTQVSDLDAKKKRLEVDAQGLLVMKRQVTLQEKELQCQLSTLQDKRQTTEQRVGQTQLRMDTLDSEMAAAIASLPVDIAPLQLQIRQVRRQKERLRSLPYVSPSGASEEDAPSPPQDQCIVLPDPDTIIYGPDIIRTLLNLDGLKEFNIQIDPLINLVDTYLSLPAPAKASFSDPDTCSAFSHWAAAHFRSASCKRPQRPEDSDDETAVDSLLTPAPRKKARTSSLSETPEADCPMPHLTPEFNAILGSFHPDPSAPEPHQYFDLTSAAATPYASELDELMNYDNPSAWGESCDPTNLRIEDFLALP